LHAQRPTPGQGIGHDGEEGQQRQVAKHQEKLRTGAAGLADLELRPADDGKGNYHQDVVDDVPMRIDDRYRHGRHRQRDPAGANGEKQALALALGNCGLGEFLGVLPDLGSSCRLAPGRGDIGRFRQCAQESSSQSRIYRIMHYATVSVTIPAYLAPASLRRHNITRPRFAISGPTP
jgi:hypothetical protein